MKKVVWILLVGMVTFACNGNGSEGDNRSVQSGEGLFDVEERLQELGIELDSPTPPTANYVRAVQSGNLVFLAGHGPDRPGGGQVHGMMGTGEMSLEEAQMAARYTGLSLLRSLKTEIGDLNRVSRIVKVTGMVRSTSDFTQHSQVINGFSDLMVEVFGEERGRHARAAVGMSSLPNNIVVEIDMIVELRE